MDIRSHFALVIAGVSIGIIIDAKEDGHITASFFPLMGNGILGYLIAGLLIAIAIGLANSFSGKKYKDAAFEDALIVASSTTVVMCLGFLFLEYSAY